MRSRLLCGVLAAGLWTGAASAQKKLPTDRSVHGVVLDAGGQPVARAIVYLKDMRTRAIRTYIADDHGAYVFHEMEFNQDYELHAESGDRHGPVRTDSAFSTAADQQMDLKLP